MPIDVLARLRMDNPGKGPQSMIGPIAVNNAEPGDVLEVRHRRIRPYEWGATFNNPSTVGTGLLPQDYPRGQVKYVDLDLGAMTSSDLRFWVQLATRSATSSCSRLRPIF